MYRMKVTDESWGEGTLITQSTYPNVVNFADARGFAAFTADRMSKELSKMKNITVWQVEELPFPRVGFTASWQTETDEHFWHSQVFNFEKVEVSS